MLELNNSLNEYKLNIRNYEVMGESNFFLQQQMSNIQKNMNNKRRNMAIIEEWLIFTHNKHQGLSYHLHILELYTGYYVVYLF